LPAPLELDHVKTVGSVPRDLDVDVDIDVAVDVAMLLLISHIAARNPMQPPPRKPPPSLQQQQPPAVCVESGFNNRFFSGTLGNQFLAGTSI